MKKLMIALVAVAFGVAAQAASFTWAVQSGYVYNGTGETGAANRMSGTAYLFNAAAYSQSALLTAFYANDLATITGSALNSATLTGGRVDETTFETTLTANTDTYFAVFSSDSKSVYLSVGGTSEYDSVMGQHSLTFGSVTASSKAFVSTTGGSYAGAGWYQNASSPVPEPTSGLLMLLGMAGLALRRRRA